MIDIKTLTIGSHVLVGGKRVKVDEIRTLRPDGVDMRLTVSYYGFVYGNPSIDEVEPIPITPELLEELGFSVKEPYIRLENETQSLISQSIEFRYMSKIGHYELTFRKRYEYANVFTCRYLHEAEAFLALNGVELIKE